MLLTYILSEGVQNLVGSVLLISTFTKLILHYKLLVGNSSINIEFILSNLLRIGIMKPIKGDTNNIKMINICVVLFYICLSIIFSQWFIK
jgi:hypothetical protein